MCSLSAENLYLLSVVFGEVPQLSQSGNTHTHSHPHTHADTHKHTHTHTQRHTHINRQTGRHTRTHTCAHRHIHRHTYRQTDTHTHTPHYLILIVLSFIFPECICSHSHQQHQLLHICTRCLCDPGGKCSARRHNQRRWRLRALPGESETEFSVRLFPEHFSLM